MRGTRVVKDSQGNGCPMRVWHRQVRGRKAARIRVRCGCCSEFVDIYIDDLVTGDPSVDMLEINGVMGTVDQWRQILLPVLGVKA